MPRLTQSEIHSDFSTASGTWTGYRAEVTGFYNDYPNSELDAHTSREYNRKISNLGQDDSLYLHPYDAGFGYRGDGYNFFDILGNAAAAYSLRSIDPTKDPSVVEVRRSSDNATSTFTASQVSDGTLTSWVNTEYNIHTSDFSSDVDGWVARDGTTTPNVDSIGGRNDCLRFVENGQDPFHFIYLNQVFNSDNQYRVSAEVYLPSSNTQVDEIRLSNGGYSFLNETGATSTFLTDQWVTISFTGNRRDSSQQSKRLQIDAYVNGSRNYTGNGTDTFYVRNIQIDQLTADGHVTTWYDQSIGGTNHATQTTSSNQPKIVDSGTLVTEGGKPALDFDGTDDYFEMTSNVFAEQLEVAVVNHIEENATKWQRLITLSNGTNDDFMVVKNNNSQLALRTSTTQGANTSKKFGNNTVINNHNLIYATSTLSTDSYTVAVDGASLSPSSGPVLGAGSFSISTIGVRSDLSSTSFSEGTIQEIVIYDTDQSANRVQMGNSIMNYYNIS